MKMILKTECFENGMKHDNVNEATATYAALERAAALLKPRVKRSVNSKVASRGLIAQFCPWASKTSH